jgi:hypothetical protein
VFCLLKCVDSTTGTHKVILSQMSNDMCSFFPNYITICGNVIRVCLLELCSRSRYQCVQQQMFHWFLLLWERLWILLLFSGVFTVVLFVDTWSPNCDTRWTSVVICVSAFTEMYISTICCKWFLLSLIHPSPFSVKLSLIHNIIWSVKLIMYSLLMTNAQNGNCDSGLKISRQHKRI